MVGFGVVRDGRSAVLGFVVFSAVTLFAATAGAEPSDEALDAASGGTAREWYGWQTLAVDEMANAFLLAGFATEEQAFINAWAISFTLGAPVVHALHRQPAEMGVSFVLRIGFPLMGGLVANLGQNPFDHCYNPEPELPRTETTPLTVCPSETFLLGAAVGGLLATGLDAGFLAFKERAPRARQSGSSAFVVNVGPRFDLKKQTVALALDGAF